MIPIQGTDQIRNSRNTINTNFQNLNNNKSEKSEIQSGSLVYGLSAGTGGNYTLTLTPPPTAYVAGMRIDFRANHTNTGPATLNVNGLGAIPIRRLVTENLAAGDIVINAVVSVVFDGTNFQYVGGITPGVVYTAGNQTIRGVKTFENGLVSFDNFTYGETITVNQAVYLRASDGLALRTSASFNDERIHNFIGFAKTAGGLNDIRAVQTSGIVSGFTGLVRGVDYFLSDTAGAISTTSGANEMPIGIAISTTELLLLPMTRKKYVDENITIKEAICAQSDVVRLSSDILKTISWGQTSPIMVKEIRIFNRGGIRVTYDTRLSNQNAHHTSFISSQVRINGATVGSLHHNFNITFQTYTDNINVNTNDLVQLFMSASNVPSGQHGECRNFRISFTPVITSRVFGNVTLN